MIAENVAIVTNKIAQAASRAGRKSEEIRIVAAAKGQNRDKIEEALAAGIRIIGHNYVQEADSEMPSVWPAGADLHMIGHLQKNKVGKAAGIFHMIETVDDEKLARLVSLRAHALNRTVGVLIQVNLANEPQKSGIEPEKVEKLAETIMSLPALRMKGLMTMPPFFDEPEKARPYFAQLRELREKLISSRTFTTDVGELSMGMTGDFEAAVEEGATLVRIGTAIFGPRP